MEYKLRAIGIIHTPCKTKEDCPIQGAIQPEGKVIIDMFSEYAKVLKNIEIFSHIILLCLLDKAGEAKLVWRTFFDNSPHVVFASRHS